jgi:hypothetical protein
MEDVVSACVNDLEAIKTLITDISSAGQRRDLFSDFVGPHIRHIVEHYNAFLDAVSSDDTIYYDRRRRDQTISDDPQVAIAHVEQIMVRINALNAMLCDRNEVRVTVELVVSPNLTKTQKMGSSALRELYFLMHHTVHHCALINRHCEQNGIRVPSDFGKAPATIGYEKLLQD